MRERLIRAGLALLTLAACSLVWDRLGPHPVEPPMQDGHSRAPVVSPDKAPSVG